jgi:hypothetical protein
MNYILKYQELIILLLLMVLSAFVNKVFLTISILTLLILQMKLILTIIFPSEIKNETKIYKKYYILLKRNNFSKNEKRLIKLYIRLISTLS